MRVAILGGGTIARLFLEHIRRGDLGAAEVVAIVGRNEGSMRGKPLATEFGVACVTSIGDLLKHKPDVVVEAASHEAVREYCGPLLDAGVAVIVLSAGALSDDKLRVRLEAAALKTGALLYVPSGGIGGLDALKAACIAGVDSVEIIVSTTAGGVAEHTVRWKNEHRSCGSARTARSLRGRGARRRAAFPGERQYCRRAVDGRHRL